MVESKNCPKCKTSNERERTYCWVCFEVLLPPSDSPVLVPLAPPAGPLTTIHEISRPSIPVNFQRTGNDTRFEKIAILIGIMCIGLLMAVSLKLGLILGLISIPLTLGFFINKRQPMNIFFLTAATIGATIGLLILLSFITCGVGIIVHMF